MGLLGLRKPFLETVDEKREAGKRNFKERTKIFQGDFCSVLLYRDISASFWVTGALSSPTLPLGPSNAFFTHGGSDWSEVQL